MSGTSPSTPMRSWTSGAMVRNTTASKRSGGHGTRSEASHGRAAATKASTDMARRYSLFIHSSFFTSKKAGAWLTSASSNPATISGTDRISRPWGSLQPSRAR